MSKPFDIKKVSKFYWVMLALGGMFNLPGYMMMILLFSWHDQATEGK